MSALRGARCRRWRSCRGSGVRIAIDDFGTGYSEPGLPAPTCPVDGLKLAGSFVTGRGWRLPRRGGSGRPGPRRRRQPGHPLGDDRAGAHPLGLTVVAESVETGWQARRLHDLGSTSARAGTWGSPRPAAELAALLAGAR
ncbi:hypothetical protein [Pseudonocardia sp. ICBG1142]|uniref:hypothetical protein n=1 Tax=Pseudonocardia sp. ICBG1142 TaxID=2846760 RepID=UPI0035A91A4C